MTRKEKRRPGPSQSFTLSTGAAVAIGVTIIMASVGWGRMYGAQKGKGSFKIEEATIGGIQSAIMAKQITTVDVVNLYLTRIKAYNGTCVNMPEGLLGPITTIPHAGQI